MYIADVGMNFVPLFALAPDVTWEPGPPTSL